MYLRLLCHCSRLVPVLCSNHQSLHHPSIHLQALIGRYKIYVITTQFLHRNEIREERWGRSVDTKLKLCSAAINISNHDIRELSDWNINADLKYQYLFNWTLKLGFLHRQTAVYFGTTFFSTLTLPYITTPTHTLYHPVNLSCVAQTAARPGWKKTAVQKQTEAVKKS